MTTHAFHIRNEVDASIHGIIRVPGEDTYPIVLLIHGFRGSMNWGFFPFMSQHFAERGILSISWNMSLNGYSPDSQYIDIPDEFAENTISRELNDTQCIINALFDPHSEIHSRISQHWNGKLYVLGHSRGAGIGILIAHMNPHITKLALWNPISRFGRFTERQKQAWKESGIFQVDITESGIPVNMNYSYIEDLEQHADTYSLGDSIATMNCEILIIHGEQDMTVPLREAVRLQEHASNAELVVLPSTGHVFGCTHPFTGSTKSLDKALHHTLEFFNS